MRNHVTKLLAVLAVLVSAPLAAQTPEGTTITNTVSATFKDANNNSYTATPASVAITVGFKGGIDVVAVGTAQPTSPSTANELAFTIDNIGNGTDSVTVTTSAGAGVTITGYKIGATSYADLTALNAALAGTVLAGITGTVEVIVVYDVSIGQGGLSIPLALTATSRRDGLITDTHTTQLQPPVSGSVAVTAQVPTANKLPGSTSTTFVVSNTTSTSQTFTLSTAVTGAISGAAITGGNSLTVPANQQSTVTVTYTVGSSGSGTLTLTATAGSFSDDDVHTVTVIKPQITLTKTAFVNGLDGDELGPTDKVVPGDEVWYRLTITNTGTAAATNVIVTDVLPSQVTFVELNPTTITNWTLNQASGTVTITLNTGQTMAVNASLTIWVKVTVN